MHIWGGSLNGGSPSYNDGCFNTETVFFDLDDDWGTLIVGNLHMYIWRFPEMVVALVIIHFRLGFPIINDRFRAVSIYGKLHIHIPPIHMANLRYPAKNEILCR